MTNNANFEFPDFDNKSTPFMSWEEFQTADGMQKLIDHYNNQVDELNGLFENCTVLRCEPGNVSILRNLGDPNFGRANGNDLEALAVVQRNFKNGWNLNKVPPFSFEDNTRINGAHRLWDLELKEITSCPTYRVVPKEGFTRDDVHYEVGLLHQPLPEGTPAKFEDYAINGINWWHNRRAKMDVEIILENWDRETQPIPQKIVTLVTKWVMKYAKHETSTTQELLIQRILNSTEKKSFLVNFTRGEAKTYCSKRGIKIKNVDSKTKIHGSEVHRLISAMDGVHIYRDFLPQFFKDAKKGITTILDLYLNVKKIDKASKVEELCTDQIKLLEEYLTLISEVTGSEMDYLKYLQLGYRLPHVAKTDIGENGASQLVPLKSPTGILASCKVEFVDPEEFEAKKAKKSKKSKKDGLTDEELRTLYMMTYALLNQNFERGIPFNFQSVSDIVYPVRTTVSTFKSMDSFEGTLRSELQKLRDLGKLEFTRPSWYTLR
tara:strand:+ start:137 stop:1609 length:1473 start_codon:yes stop_codon:yes gene_type:complete